jgi:predicted dehydrogenase
MIPGSRIGVAVVGCGYWGMNYVRLFSELPEARLVAVCDRKPERLEEVNWRFPGVMTTPELDEVLGWENVAGVVICTEAVTHFPMARCCLLAGKHVLVEKPITTTVTHAEEISLLAEQYRLTLMVGHTFIYNPGIKKIKEYMLEGGQPYYLYARRTNLGPIRRDVNALWDLATHDIAIFNYLLDQVPMWVSAIGAKVLGNCREDVGFITLGYRNNCLGHIHVSWADPNKTREVVAVCSDKRIVFNDLKGVEQVRVFEKGVKALEGEPSSYGEYRLQIRDGDIVSPKLDIVEPLKEECRHFLHCVRSGDRPITSGWDGRDVLRVLEAIDQSVSHNGGRMEIPANGNYLPQETAMETAA